MTDPASSEYLQLPFSMQVHIDYMCPFPLSCVLFQSNRQPLLCLCISAKTATAKVYRLLREVELLL